jgi:methylenetetrahydrofolate reductase (NADPH)
MTNVTSELKGRIESGERVLVAEVSPPKSGNPDRMRELARSYVGKVHALGVSDNQHGVSMSALAAASLAAQEGVEPILHVVTRDRNRIALVSERLGAQALGIRNILCTTGTHQTLGAAGAAKNVFDLDSIQLLQAYANLSKDGSFVGEKHFEDSVPLCLGAAVSQHAEPHEMQMMRLAKKVEAGAQFLITEPVYDIQRFETFWNEATSRALHEKVAILAGIRLLGAADAAKSYADSRPDPKIPEELLERLAAKDSSEAQEVEGAAIAVETIKQLSQYQGLRGFEVRGDGNDAAALDVIHQSGLGVS